MFLRIVSIVLPVFLIAVLGYLYGRYKRPDMAVVNQINMDIFVPALIFFALARKEFSLDQYYLAAIASLVVILGSGALAYPVARFTKIPWRTFVPPMMFTNSGNLGLPLMVLTFGPEALSIAVVFLLVENVAHFTLGRYWLDRSVQPLQVLGTPVVLAAILGIGFSLTDIEMPQVFAISLEMVGNISIPLLLFSLGVRLIEINWKDWSIGLLGALVCPLSGILIALIASQILGLSDLQTKQLILFGALPPALLNYLFADQFNQEPERVASMVMISNLATVVTIPLVLVWLL